MFGIYPETIVLLNQIFSSYAVDEVIIYGSRAKGNYREGSDIDLTVKGGISSKDMEEIKNRLYNSNIPYLIDLSLYNEIESESLKDHIDRIGKVFYKRESI